MSAARTMTSKTFAALSVRNFRLYAFGQLISVSGTWMQSVALGWLVLQLSGSSVDLGIAVALQYLPTLLAGSYGGLVADRHQKRAILYATQTSAGLLALLLGILVSSHHASVPMVYVLSFLLGVANLFDVPARQAFVQQMVGRDLLTNAVSLNSVLMNAGRLVGPAVATAFIAVAGTASCFYANAASYAAVLVALAIMRSTEFVPMRTVAREKGQLRKGLAYVRSTPSLRRAVIAVAVVSLFAFNFTVTLPVLAHVTFHQRSATHYGLLMGAMGLGAVFGGLFVAYRSRPTHGLLAVLALGFGASLSAVALAPSLLWAELLLVPTGAFSVAFVSTCNATMQLNSSSEMRGRVMSLYSIAFFGTTPIGAPLIGWIIHVTNARVGILVGSSLTVVIGLWLALTHERARRHSQAAVVYTD